MPLFYSNIKTGEIPKYQEYFLEMLECADVENLTKWSQGLQYDKAEYDKSYEKHQPILDRAEKDDLTPLYLQIMFEQYIFADTLQRERYKTHWFERVLRRDKEDFFPDPKAILKILDEE